MSDTTDPHAAVEGHDGIFVVRAGKNCRDWNGIHYQVGLSGKNVGAKSLSMNVATIPPGGVAWTHVHRGPGIRCLLAGSVRVEVNGQVHDVEPGGAWFEAGPDPVLAIASKTVPTAFARVMILPRELRGKSSIRYVKPEEADKPRLQTYRVFVDEFIDLPR